MENLILEWQKRQQKYEELAEKYKDNAHNNRKFTYKAMATRDCWKELALQLQQTGVKQSVFFSIVDNGSLLEKFKEKETAEYALEEYKKMGFPDATILETVA